MAWRRERNARRPAATGRGVRVQRTVGGGRSTGTFGNPLGNSISSPAGWRDVKPDALPEAWATPVPEKLPPPGTDGLPTVELEQSKVLARLRYKESDRTLIVEFRSGAVYRFFGVPRDDYTTLATSASPGARFSSHIQPYHEFERLA